MTLDDPERRAHIALALVPGIGSRRLAALVEHCGSALGALAAPFAFLGTVPGISRAAATAIQRASLDDAETVLTRTERLGARLLVPADPDFPALLREIHDPPPLLFALGDTGLLRREAVAIVGSRDHTPYGAAVARTIVASAVGAGLVVVSGMARGLDAVAHAAALDASGDTIGVLGNGLGVVYPAANRALYERVAARGLLLTEFPPGERPHAGSFPQRNRLISGLCRATVVVEAAVQSGALVTAGAALEQGREVYAVPGPVTSAVSEGTNRLLRDGATPWLEPDDLLERYGLATGDRAGAVRPAEPPALVPLPEGLDPDAAAVAAALDAEPLPLEVLAERAGHSPAELLGVVTRLELAGVAAVEPGPAVRRLTRSR